MLCACFDLYFKVFNILVKIFRFNMTFGIASSRNVEVTVFLYKACEVARILKIVQTGDIGVDIAPECKDIFNVALFELFKAFEDKLFVAVNAGEVRSGCQSKLILNI